ncbi:MAG: hypothetical protein IT497_10060 [Ottowia sp.]|nr:hypothetical protein [Ottowia sp.]
MTKDSREPQKPRYIQSCLAIYDLHGFWKKLEDPGYNYYFYEEKLANGLNLKIRSDGYYVLDFRDCSIGAPIKQEDSNYGEIFAIHNKRVEVVHALLACLRGATQRESRQSHTMDMDFIDNFIVCSRETSDLEALVEMRTSSNFSSAHYQKLCKIRLKEIQETSTFSNLNREKIFEATAAILNKLANLEKGRALYILGIFYRAAVYHKMGLAMHSAIFLRSIFEWLAESVFPCVKDKKQRYENLLGKYQYSGRDACLIKKLTDSRHDAIHKLIFPPSDLLDDPILKSFRIIEKIFFSEIGINELSIPLGRGMFSILEEKIE